MPTYKKHPALRIYLISRWFYLHHLKLLAHIFYRINNVVYQCNISYEAELSPKVRMCHARGIFIRRGVKVEEGTVLFQQVILAVKYPDTEIKIHIGKNCLIGANACVLGNVTIGDNVTIGANTVVTKDIPSNCLVVSQKAKVIKRKKKKKKK